MLNRLMKKVIFVGIILLFVETSFVFGIGNDIKKVNKTNDWDIFNPNLVTLIFFPSGDVCIGEDIPNENIGYSQLLRLRTLLGWRRYDLIKFNISSIPSEVDIYSAIFKLYYFEYNDGNPSGHNVSVYRVTEDWDELIVTWNTQPNHTAMSTNYSIVPGSFGWMEWNLTDDVQDFIDGSVSNYGWKLIDNHPSEQSIYNFHSKEFSGDLIPTLEIAIPSPAMVYVDNNFNSSTPGWGYDHFDKIQDGVDSVNVSGTVYVYNGTYHEHVVVNKTINLIGENRDTTIINGDGSGNTVYISADWVNITRFYTRGSGYNWINAGIMIRSSFGKIWNNKCANNEFAGIGFKNAIDFVYSEGINISDNIVAGNRYGILLNNLICNSTISGNVIKNNHWYGICLSHGSKDNIFFNNTIDNTFNQGWGIWSSGCHNNLFYRNTISNNSLDGIHLSTTDNNNVFYRNTISNNSLDGIKLRGYNNNFTDNFIISNNANGINLCETRNNYVSGNNINSNYNGIYLQDPCINNIITGNNISLNNNYGVYISGCKSNLFYHNNFINNFINAYDDSNNTWDDGYPSGGNHWDDYIGEDDNDDGIGDTPYNISGGDNQDLYPLMHLFGPPYAKFEYVVDMGTVEFNASKSGDYNGYIVNYEWDFGDGTNGTGMIVDHDFSEVGTYDVTLTVMDNDGFEDDETKTVVLTNQPPNTPVINGPNSGKPDESYSYNFVAEDPNGDDVYYEIDWGEGSVEPWDGPHESNIVISRDHIWDQKGEFTIMARAKDEYGLIGEWGTFDVTMPKNKAFIFSFPFLNWLFEQFTNAFPIFRYIIGLT